LVAGPFADAGMLGAHVRPTSPRLRAGIEDDDFVRAPVRSRAIAPEAVSLKTEAAVGAVSWREFPLAGASV
jgi:hypothetical protein